MAFALSIGVPTPSGKLMMTTILVVCIFTVVVLGGAAGKTLQFLDIDMHLDPSLASDDDDAMHDSRWLQLDRRFLKPFFTRLRPRTRVDEEPDQLDLDEREFMDFERVHSSQDHEEAPGGMVELRPLGNSNSSTHSQSDDRTAHFRSSSTSSTLTDRAVSTTSDDGEGDATTTTARGQLSTSFRSEEFD